MKFNVDWLAAAYVHASQLVQMEFLVSSVQSDLCHAMMDGCGAVLCLDVHGQKIHNESSISRSILRSCNCRLVCSWFKQQTRMEATHMLGCCSLQAQAERSLYL